jgi:uncharacterized metal-binding protein YceD (DUF177 family)
MVNLDGHEMITGYMGKNKKGGRIMSFRIKALALSIFLLLVFLMVGPAPGVVAVPTLTISQLVTSGQTVTLQAPSGDYLYQWTAESEGANIGAGTSQKFTFTAPLVTQEEGSKAVTVSLYIRTIEGGCVNQSTTDINVYSLPVCGIGGPEQVGPYDVATYSYTGGTEGQLTFVWSIDGKKIDGATGSSVDIDWSQYDVVNHTVGMTLTRDYSDVAPGSTNPFRSISCTFQTNVTYTTGMELAKTASATAASVGEAVTYTYTVRNTGTIGINSLALKDDKLGELKLESTSIMPGETTTATSTYTILESDLPGPLNNTAVVSGAEDRTNKAVSATANATVALTYNAALNLTKVPSTTTAAVGETVTYRFTVTNTGNVTIKGLNLTDDKLGTIKTDKTSLSPGETATASATHIIAESDLPGPLTNVATITGTDSQNKPVSTTATATVALTYTASLAVTKEASSETAAIGDTITYSYTVTNNGTVTVNGLTLNDDRLGAIALDRDTLAPGETATGTASHIVVEADLPGPMTNVATAAGTDSQGAAVTSTATATVALTYTSALQVTKTPSTQKANVGDTITYDYQVSNVGSVTINALALSDDRLGAITLDRDSLGPGETANGSATYTVLETDLPGPLTNVATATGTDSQSGAVTSEATATVALTYTAALQVTKTPSATTAAVGETVTYQFAVANTGNVTINALTLNDDRLGAIALDRDALAPGETATGTATHTIVETDLPGPLTNVATAAGTDSQGAAVTGKATATVDLTYAATLEVTKTPSSSTASVGETIDYSYAVRNTGTVTISSLKLIDDRLGAITLDRDSLGPGETATGTISYTVVEKDLPGPLTNVATATAKDVVGNDVTSQATAAVTLTYAASMEITKTASTDTANVGDTVTYTYTVTNTGAVTLSGLSLADDKLGAISIAKDTLAAGETTTGTATYKVVEADLPGPLTNVVTGTATDSQGQPVTNTATATVALTYTASLAVTKEASSETAAIGDTITYSYTVTNNGTVTVNGLTLNDDRLGAIALDRDTLAPGETATGTASHIVVEADLPGPMTNVATAAGTDSQGAAVTSTATATVALTYTSALQVTKTPSTQKANVGDTITYDYQVSNVGSVTINALALSDDRLGAITLDRDSLGPGETANGSATYTVLETDLPGPLTNVATATGTDSQSGAVTSEATATVALTYTAALQVTKTPSATTAAVGETVTYQFAVANTGNVTINALTLNDDRLGAIALDRDALAPGETATGTATHTIVETDLPGPLTNVATAAGTDSQGAAVTGKATATVDLTYAATLEVTKTPSSSTASVGETIDYSYAVRNTGTVTISSLKLIDDRLGAITLDRDSLGPGETATGTISYTVVEKDLPGPLTNVATATAKDVVGNDVTSQATAAVTLTYAASMEITKTASTDTANVGDTVTYTYTVTNTGAVTLSGLSLADDKLGAISIAKDTLAAGETTTGTATYKVAETDLPGPLTNVVTGTATDSQGQPVTNTATATVALTYAASLAVTKEASSQKAAIGDTITYTFSIVNTGDVTISGLILRDDKLGDINPEKDTLAPGESTTATIDHKIVEADLPSPLTNVVTVEGTDSQGQTVTSTATTSVDLTYTASLDLTKAASSRSAKVGETVTYTYTITNNGDVTISSLVLNDDKLGSISLSQDSIAPGGTVTATTTYTIAVEDVPGPVVNNAELTGTDPTGGSVSATASASVTITREAIAPVLTCVAANSDGTYTAFFGYDNPNSYPVTIEKSSTTATNARTSDNRFTPPPDDQGQPITFEPGSQSAVFAVVFKGNSVVWHLDGKVAEANKNSGGCSQAGCGLEGPALCRNREEIYSYTEKEDPQFTQTYNWSVDDKSVGTGKSITLNGADYQEGEYKLNVLVTRYYLNKLWSTEDCSMDLKVIPEPSAEISMEEVT